MPPDHPYRHVQATPGIGYEPALWLLGSSDYSATAAGQLGLPFSFAYHFAAEGVMSALDAYRTAFRPVADLDTPYAMLGVTVVSRRPTSRRGGWRRRVRWRSFGFAPGVRAATRRLRRRRQYRFTPAEKEFVRSFTASHIVGSPETVRRGLQELVERTGADELMLSTMVSDHRERIRSFELVAEVMDLAIPVG